VIGHCSKSEEVMNSTLALNFVRIWSRLSANKTGWHKWNTTKFFNDFGCKEIANNSDYHRWEYFSGFAIGNKDEMFGAHGACFQE
jgi:hypothetical protein